MHNTEKIKKRNETQAKSKFSLLKLKDKADKC